MLCALSPLVWILAGALCLLALAGALLVVTVARDLIAAAREERNR